MEMSDLDFLTPLPEPSISGTLKPQLWPCIISEFQNSDNFFTTYQVVEYAHVLCFDASRVIYTFTWLEALNPYYVLFSFYRSFSDGVVVQLMWRQWTPRPDPSPVWQHLQEQKRQCDCGEGRPLKRCPNVEGACNWPIPVSNRGDRWGAYAPELVDSSSWFSGTYFMIFYLPSLDHILWKE